jgi:hypothetical protein
MPNVAAEMATVTAATEVAGKVTTAGDMAVGGILHLAK